MSSLDFLDRAVATAADRTGSWVRRHPKSLTAAVVVSLAGFGVTAFGIAPNAPDPADLPRRIVTEIVTSEDTDAQLEALAAHSLQLYRSDTTRSSDSIDSLFARLNISDPSAAAFLRTDSTARKLLEGRAGKMVQVRTTESGMLEELVARFPAEDLALFNTHFSRLRVLRHSEGVLDAMIEVAPLSTQVRLGSGNIRSSLFAATDEARIPDPVAIQMAEIFSTDIDFHRELRRGDTFSVIYEARTADGEPVTWNQAVGRVLAAEFVNNGRTHAAVWFQDGARGGYYGFDGQSKRRSFLASPMEFSRVTSGFSMRMHPIHKTWRRHLGVDYGAPTGTPVRAVGDGVVEFAGWQNGYGNVVQLRHTNDRTTLYAHLSRIDVKRGQRIDQGTRIGAVGATGWATGPHLHFEVKVKGVHQDPMRIAKASESVTIAPSARGRFDAISSSLRGQLDIAASIAEAGGSFGE